MQAFGWTWEYIDECMTVPRLNLIYQHWAESPPLHIMIANFLGIQGKPARGDQAASIAELMHMFPG